MNARIDCMRSSGIHSHIKHTDSGKSLPDPVQRAFLRRTVHDHDPGHGRTRFHSRQAPAQLCAVFPDRQDQCALSVYIVIHSLFPPVRSP